MLSPRAPPARSRAEPRRSAGRGPHPGIPSSPRLPSSVPRRRLGSARRSCAERRRSAEDRSASRHRVLRWAIVLRSGQDAAAEPAPSRARRHALHARSCAERRSSAGDRTPTRYPVLRSAIVLRSGQDAALRPVAHSDPALGHRPALGAGRRSRASLEGCHIVSSASSGKHSDRSRSGWGCWRSSSAQQGARRASR